MHVYGTYFFTVLNFFEILVFMVVFVKERDKKGKRTRKRELERSS